MLRLEGQIAIVTGAAQGVGNGIAEVLGAEGAHVVVADVDGNSADRAVRDLRAAGLEASAMQVDVASRDAVFAMVERTLGEWKRVDVLAANAGVYPTVPLATMTEADWDGVMAVNIKGTVHAVQACLPSMLDRGYGRIVLTSSVTGPITGYPGYAAYGASKAAMLGFMRSAAVELATSGVTVNAVLPGNVATPGLSEIGEDHVRHMLAAIPAGRFATPEDVGWAVRFLASPEAGYITGQTLVVDGGQVLPEAPMDD
jgi:3-oxoacyl-[acyl-carrier protein] reductase